MAEIPEEHFETDVLIIGGGAAGTMAAFACAAAGVRVIQATKGRHILIFSESSKEKRHVMINLTQPNSKDVGFEINRSNIILEGLKISKDVVLAGGSELDVAKIYKETISDLDHTHISVRHY